MRICRCCGNWGTVDTNGDCQECATTRKSNEKNYNAYFRFLQASLERIEHDKIKDKQFAHEMAAAIDLMHVDVDRFLRDPVRKAVYDAVSLSDHLNPCLPWDPYPPDNLWGMAAFAGLKKMVLEIENYSRASNYERVAQILEEMELWDLAGEVRRRAANKPG